MLLTGQTFGRFRILASAGRGGMGEVYRAEDTTLGRVVALKTIRSDYLLSASESAGERELARFEREARVLAALSHPNIVTIYSFEAITPAEGGDAVYVLCMEWINGRSLRAAMNESIGHASQRITWLRDIGSALAALHRAGIVHRDLKPDNVMLGDDGRLRLVDFGIARITPESAVVDSPGGHLLTRTRDVIGTRRYMAPEQTQGARVDGRADQFAWGVVAYELLAGDHPQNLLPDDEPLNFPRVLPPPITKSNAFVSDAISMIVWRSLAEHPDARFASMDALVADLDRSTAPAPPIHAMPRAVTTSNALPRPPKSNAPIALIFAVSVLGVLVLSAIVVGIVFLTREPVTTTTTTLTTDAGPLPPTTTPVIPSAISSSSPTATTGPVKSAAPSKPPAPSSKTFAFRSIALDSKAPPEMDQAAFRTYFAGLQPSLLKCFTKDPPLRECTGGVGEGQATCRFDADGKVSECSPAVNSGRRPDGQTRPPCWSAVFEVQSCVAGTFNGSRAPPLTQQSAEKKGQFTTAAIVFHAVE